MSWATVSAQHTTQPVVFVAITFASGARYYSTTYVRTATRSYKGNIVNLPEIRSSVGDIKRTYEKNLISIVFSDADYEFRGIEETENPGFRNRPVTVQVAFADDAYATPLTLYSGRIYDWRRLDNLQYQIDVEENSLNLTNEYPDKRVEITDYPYADPSAIGWTVPTPYGVISALATSGDGAYGHPSLSPEGYGGLPLVDNRLDVEVTLVGRQAAAITVDRVYFDGFLMTSGVDYNIGTQTIGGFTFTEIRWTAGLNPTNYNRISCDITFGTRRPVEAIQHFLINFCEYASGDFDSTSYTAATTMETNRGYSFAGVMWEAKQLLTILDQWRDEFELDMYWNKAGKVCFQYLTSVFLTPRKYNDVTTILAGFDSDPQVKELMNRLKHGYNFHYSRTYFYNYGTYEDTASQTKYGETFEVFQGFYWIRDTTMAYDIASRKVIRFKDPITFDELRLPLTSFSDDVAGMVSVTHAEGVGAAGYVDKYFQVRVTNYNINQFVNTVLIEDAKNFTGNAFILGDETVLAATWAAATGAERNYGYLCSDTTAGAEVAGEFSDGEPGKRMFD
jgi:hypothetical protein